MLILKKLKIELNPIELNPKNWIEIMRDGSHPPNSPLTPMNTHAPYPE